MARKESLSLGGIIQIVGILTSASLGLAALILSVSSGNKIDATRVELGDLPSNSNNPDFSRPWEQWEGRLTDKTTFVGVQRNIRFSKPFLNAPTVETAFSGMDVPPLDLVMREVGYHLTNPVEERRLQDIHVVSFVTGVTPEGFTLQVGIGLPRPCADYLINYLETTAVDEQDLTIARRFSQLDPLATTLTPRDRWMINFYIKVGTLHVTWLAKADQK